MRDGDWNEIMQHPDRRLTSGQLELLRDVNLATLTRQRLAAFALRMLIEADQLQKRVEKYEQAYLRLQGIVG